jgi:cell wall-associated NlpC family hydrolase
MTKLDSRLHAFRPDLADSRLAGRVASVRYAEGRVMQVAAPLVTVHKSPSSEAMQLTQALMGERLHVFDEQEGWAWVQLDADCYVGYVSANALTPALTEATHRVAVPATFLYPAANLKTQPAIAVTLNARLCATGTEGKFLKLADGHFVYADHVTPSGAFEDDFVGVAERFRHVPYYWGGKSVQGLDCSGLVQLALEACGMACPRDSDMQEQGLGTALQINDLDGLRRGDLVFWNGHVGIMTDSSTLLHANGHHMMVVAEPLREAVGRIAGQYGQITSLKRL